MPRICVFRGRGYATHGANTWVWKLYPTHKSEGRMQNARSYACASDPQLRKELDIIISRKNATRKSSPNFAMGSCLLLLRRPTADSGRTPAATPADQLRASEKNYIYTDIEQKRNAGNLRTSNRTSRRPRRKTSGGPREERAQRRLQTQIRASGKNWILIALGGNPSKLTYILPELLSSSHSTSIRGLR